MEAVQVRVVPVEVVPDAARPVGAVGGVVSFPVVAGGTRTMRSSCATGVPRPSLLLVVTQSQPSGPTATVRSRP